MSSVSKILSSFLVLQERGGTREEGERTGSGEEISWVPFIAHKNMRKIFKNENRVQ